MTAGADGGTMIVLIQAISQPGHFRVLRDFMSTYDSILNEKLGRRDGSLYTSDWDKLLTGTYQVLYDNQCESTGFTTNWFSIQGSSATDLTDGGSTSWWKWNACWRIWIRSITVSLENSYGLLALSRRK